MAGSRLGAFLAAILLLSGCGSEDTESTPTAVAVAGIPSASAPLGLAEVEWQADQAGVEALIAALPDNLHGLARDEIPTGPPRYQVTYGPRDVGRSGLVVMDLESGDFFPVDWTAGDVISYRTENADVVASGQDGPLVWLRDETTETRGENESRLVTLMWGAADGTWLYSAGADSQERLAQIVQAVVDARSGL